MRTSGSGSHGPLSRVALLAAAALLNFSSPPGTRAAPPAAMPSFAEPALSPDGAEIAFVSAGDIWTVPAGGGEARLLVSHEANESRPLYSPDGKRLAFVSTRSGAGDIYVLTFASGEVARVTYDDAPEELNAWSRDGKYLYFSSGGQELGGVNSDIFRINSAGGTPMPLSAEPYWNESYAAPSPDGKVTAFAGGGASNRDWYRAGHAHWSESQIWLRRDRGWLLRPIYEAITPPGAKDVWPLWAEDGKTLYYVSDRDGHQNLWAQSLNDKDSPAGDARELTHFTEGRVLGPTISYDGKTIVFERDFGVWKLNTSGGDAQEVKITPRGAPAAPEIEHANFVGGFRELALSPDGRKVAFIVHGEVFAASAKDGGRAVRVTHTAAAESMIEWAPDSRRLVYASERGGYRNLFLYDFATGLEATLTHDDVDDSTPRFSPDGALIAFRHGGNEIRTLDLETRKQRVLAKGLTLGLPPFDDAVAPLVWSPRGSWVAFIENGANGFDNVFVAAADADGADEPAAPRQVTFFANGGSNSVSWSPDGRFMLFGTGQRTEDYQLARIDLIPRPPNFTEDQFRGLFQEEPRTGRPGAPLRPQPERPRRDSPPGPATAPADTTPELFPSTQPTTAPATNPSPDPATRPATQALRSPPVEPLSLGNIRRRVSLLSVGVDVDYQTISPDGKWAVLVGTSSGRQNLYVYPLDPASSSDAGVLRQLTTTTGAKGYLRVSPDSKEVYYLDSGQIRVTAIDGRGAREVAVTAAMDVDFASEKMEVATQAWRYLKLNFYDPKLHGVDWDAVRTRYFPHVAGARTEDELRRILSLMVGELNASHSGVHAARGRGSATVGRLGAGFDRAVYEKSGKLRVTDVLAGGPAAQAGVRYGDYILAVDGNPIDAEINLDSLLDGKIGQRVTLLRSSKADAGEESEIPVRPIDAATERTLAYRAWVESNRGYVERTSDGKLGYVHIADMSQAALARLMVDLDARAYERKGLVIDVRGNTGGFVSPFVLDVFARRGYLAITQRGGATAPGRTYVGQRALDLPSVLVANRGSVSDAENFIEGYRALGLGKVVGEPSAGGVIFTADVQLLDGTVIRIPHSRVAARDGTSLENHPRPVDVAANRLPGDTAAGKDRQLDAAVKELLQRLASTPTTNPSPTLGAAKDAAKQP